MKPENIGEHRRTPADMGRSRLCLIKTYIDGGNLDVYYYIMYINYKSCVARSHFISEKLQDGVV